MSTNKYRDFTWKDGSTPTDGSDPTPITAGNLNPIEVALRHLMGYGTLPGQIDNIEKQLQDNIDAEARTREDDDDALEARATTLEGRATELEKSVNGYTTTDADGEQTDVPGLIDNLASEITTRSQADGDLDTRKINYTDLLILKCGSSAPDPEN